MTDAEDNQSTASDSMDAFTSVTALPEDFVNTGFNHTSIQSVEPTSIQPVEPIIGLTTKEQRCREEDPNLTINELLGLS